MTEDLTPIPMCSEFATHKLNDTGIKKSQEIALIFNECLTKLLFLCPVGRELSLTRTKLEEASFFAKKAMCSDSANQQDSPVMVPGKEYLS